jgi:hypothetical protein
MFGSTVLELAVGVIFSFLMISLVTSAITEAIASGLKWRANTLLQGVKDLLNDQNFSGLALRIYNHAAVNARSNGTAATEAALSVKPSYIDAKQFAGAFIDILGLAATPNVAANVPALQDQIANSTILDPQLKTMLNGMVGRTGGNINRIRDEIAAWFDNSMNRVAGDYKRKTQAWGLAIGLGCAVILNIDTVKIVEALWDHPMLMQGFAVADSPLAKEVLNQAQQFGIPFGWNQDALTYFETGINPLYVIVGWLISAVATLFGAPFWFDSLQKFVQLRGAGST